MRYVKIAAWTSLIIFLAYTALIAYLNHGIAGHLVTYHEVLASGDVPTAELIMEQIERLQSLTSTIEKIKIMWAIPITFAVLFYRVDRDIL